MQVGRLKEIIPKHGCKSQACQSRPGRPVLLGFDIEFKKELKIQKQVEWAGPNFKWTRPGRYGQNFN